MLHNMQILSVWISHLPTQRFPTHLLFYSSIVSFPCFETNLFYLFRSSI